MTPKQRSAPSVRRLATVVDGIAGRNQARGRVGHPAPPVVTVAVLERRQVKNLDDVEHLPAQVLGRQPLPDIPRHLKVTFTVARQEVPLHRPRIRRLPDLWNRTTNRS